MPQTENAYRQAPTLGFRLFRAYVKFYTYTYLIGRVYTQNKEQLPKDGTPMLICSNHQNSLLDPIMIIFNMCPRRLTIFARGDLFINHKPFAKALMWLGISPAFRMTDVGGDADRLNELNKKWFPIIGDNIARGRSTLIFPEGTHMDKHYLGDTSMGYLTFLFQTAERYNFEKEFYIEPMAHHYSEYFTPGLDMCITYGRPISLKPYYETYKLKPRTAMRQVSALVREKISELMLDVRDVSHYDAIDYIRQSYGRMLTQRQGGDPDHLPSQLITDQKLVAKLDRAKTELKEEVLSVYENALILRGEMQANGLSDLDFAQETTVAGTLMHGLLMLLGLPLFVLGLWPFYIIDHLAMWVLKTVADMMQMTLKLGSMVLISLPVTFGITFAGLGLATGQWLYALLYVLAGLPLVGRYYFYYKRKYTRLKQKAAYTIGCDKATRGRLSDLRASLFGRLDALLDATKDGKEA